MGDPAPVYRFHPGMRVRVNIAGRRVGRVKRLLDGRTGVVVATAGRKILVDFPAERQRVMFLSVDLEPEPDLDPKDTTEAK